MVHSGLTTYDNWDRVVKQYKPFKFVSAGAPVAFAPRFNPTALYTEQQYEPNQRGHVLRAAKFGESISTGHTVNSSYLLISGYQLKIELNVPLIIFQDIAGTFLNPPLYQQRYLKTASIDEDGKKTVSYTNAFGQKVASKTYANSTSMEVTVNNKVTVWNIYNTIREIENTFRTLKTDLDLRPIYHKNDDATMAHLHLGLLAYWLVNTVRYQLKKNGITSCWSEIVRIGNTQKIITTSGTNTHDKMITIRKCSEPNKNLANIYSILKIKQQPFTKRKVVVHKSELEKNILQQIKDD